MYYVTVVKDGKDIVDRMPVGDFAGALAETSRFYTTRLGRGVLRFTTEVINGQFARSYAQLNRPEDIDEDEFLFKERYHYAAKYSNAFNYDGSYFFLIESDLGVSERESPDDHDDELP